MEYLNIFYQELYKILFLLIPILVSVAMIVWLDRRIWGLVQKRKGPNVVGPFGLLQTLADALKYMFKEIIIPASANKPIFILAPIVTMTLALIAWAVIPMSATMILADINVGVLYIFAVSSLGVYGIIMGGWASNSKYPFLGAIRSAAQMISYEVSIGIIIINVLLCVGSLNLKDIVLAQQNLWFVVPLIDIFPLNLIPAPIWMILKILFLFFLFALVKAIVPRYRYDQLMRLGWKVFLPFSLIYVVLTASFLFYFNLLPGQAY